MPSPDVVKAAIESSGANAQRGRPELLSKLESLSISYVFCAFREMGWEFREGQAFSSEEAAIKTAIADKHKRLLNHLFGMLAEEGILSKTAMAGGCAAFPTCIIPVRTRRSCSMITRN